MGCLNSKNKNTTEGDPGTATGKDIDDDVRKSESNGSATKSDGRYTEEPTSPAKRSPTTKSVSPRDIQVALSEGKQWHLVRVSSGT